MNSNKIVITTQQILDAYAAHGNDFLVINFESVRKYKEFSQYFDIDVKLADGTVSSIRYWKLSGSGIIVGSRIRKPEQRRYESIRLGISLVDEDNVENENAKAVQLICIAFETQMKQFKRDEFITDDSNAPRKQADGTYRPVYLISNKIVTPMQTITKDKLTDEVKELENPFFWLSIPKKKFFASGEVQKTSVHFDDKYYMDANGQPDIEKPVMTHEYAPKFYNVEDFFHHPRTGKKIYKRLGAVDPTTNENYLDNTNIQDYLTRGSPIIGNLKFELAVSGRQCKLDIAIYGTAYVKVAEVGDVSGQGQDDESIDAFASRYASISAPAANATQNFVDDFEEDIGDE